MGATVRLDAIPDNGTLSLTLPGGKTVCLIRRGNQVSALHDQCTHQGMSLSAGEVLPDGTIECAWHGARFDCVTGEVRRGPAEDNVKTFSVHLDGETVVIEAAQDL